MFPLLAAALIVVLLVRVLAHGTPIEAEDLLRGPVLLAFALLLASITQIFLLREAARPAAAGFAGLAAVALLVIGFPERMFEAARGGLSMTAFWTFFGWVLMGVAAIGALTLRLL